MLELDRSCVVRVVGYVRDASGPSEVEPAFAQAERVRRWVGDSGHQLVAICQDVRTPGHALGRHGFRALIGIIEAGEADGVVVPDLSILSADKITQEVMLWDLRSRDVVILSTTEEDLAALSDHPTEQLRTIVRDVLARASAHLGLVASVPVGPAAIEIELPIEIDEDDDRDDIVVELIPPMGEPMQLPGRVSPAR